MDEVKGAKKPDVCKKKTQNTKKDKSNQIYQQSTVKRTLNKE